MALAMEVEWLPPQQQHQEDSDELRQLQGQKRQVKQTIKGDTRPGEAERQGGGQDCGHCSLRHKSLSLKGLGA